MNKKLWKKRMTFLLACAILVTQLSVPGVYAGEYGDNAGIISEADAEQKTLAIPKDYISLNEAASQNVVDLSKSGKQSRNFQAKKQADEGIPKEYKTIPVVSEHPKEEGKSADAEISSLFFAEEAGDEKIGEKAVKEEPESALPELIPYIDGEYNEEAKAKPARKTATGFVMTETASEETAVSENSISIGEIVRDEILIGNEWKTRYITPEESGEYDLLFWSESYLNVEIRNMDSGDFWNYWNYQGSGCATQRLDAGTTYSVSVQSQNQCVYHMSVVKRTDMTADTAADVTLSAHISAGAEGEARLITLIPDSAGGHPYHIMCGNSEIIANDNGDYTFFVVGKQDISVWKENTEADRLTVRLEQTDVSELALEEGKSLLTENVFGNIEKMNGYYSFDTYVKFAPETSGKYFFDLKGKYTGAAASEFTGYVAASYVLGESGFEYFSAGDSHCMELEAGEIYLIGLRSSMYTESGSFSAAVVLSRLQETAVTLDSEAEIPAGGGYVAVKLEDMDFGAYEIEVTGEKGDYTIFSSSFHDSSLSINKESKSVSTVYYGRGHGNESFVIRPTDYSAADSIKLCVRKAETVITADEKDSWKQAVTMKKGEEKWFSFTPEHSGSYVFCTEEKYSNRYTLVDLFYRSNNYLAGAMAWDFSYDNNHLVYELEAGITYYYHLFGSVYDNQPAEDSFTIALYPETTVALQDTKTSTDTIRKSVAYQVTIPKAGFYQLGVSGKDESYLLKIKHVEDSAISASSFVYDDIPRSFLFKKTGTYTIWVIKEIMGEETDTVTFTYEEGAPSARLTSGRPLEADIDNTDGIWLEFTPDQTGWYSLDLNEKDDNWLWGGELSVLSENGEEIVWDRNLQSETIWDNSYGENDGEEIEKSHELFYTKLAGGRTYYYKVRCSNDTTGHVTAVMSGVAKEGLVSAEKEQKWDMTENLLILKTAFDVPNLLSIVDSLGASVRVRDITESVNGDRSEYLSREDALYVPGGQREYLVIRLRTEKAQITTALQMPESIQTTVSIPFTAARQYAWMKLTPAQTGFYILSNEEPEDVSYTQCDLYLEEDSRLVEKKKVYHTDLSGKTGTIAYLEQGKEYYYRVSCETADNVTVAYTLFFSDGQKEALSIGTNRITLSGNELWCGKNAIEESGYYEIKTVSGAKKASIKLLTVDQSGIVSKKSISVTGESKKVYLENGSSAAKSCYAVISADDDVELSVVQLPAVSKTVAFGDCIEEEASDSVKEYHFTPEETGAYSIVLTSDDAVDGYSYEVRMIQADNQKTVSAHAKSTENLAGKSRSRYSCYYNLTGGQEYICYVAENRAYTITLTETKDKYVYDYDYCEAFIASGGTIRLVDELTDDMLENWEDEYADCDMTNNKYLYFDATGFENPNEIWFPSWRGEVRTSYDNLCDREVTYQNILDDLNAKGRKRYKVTDLYRPDGGSMSEFAKAVLSEELSLEDEIVLARCVPAVVLIQNIRLEGPSLMQAGQKAVLTAQADTGNQYEATNPRLLFASSDSSILTVDADGNLEAKKAGKAKVICSSEDGNAKAELEIAVKRNVVLVEKVTVTGAARVWVGDTVQLFAKTDTNGKGKPTMDGVNWSSSDISTATVDENGKVTALKPGSVTITAASKDGNAAGSIVIRTEEVLASRISINDSKILMKKGTTYKWLEYTFSPKNTTDKTVTLTSSNSKVVSVTPSGDLKAKAVGTAVVTAKTKNGKSDTVKVTVTAGDIKVKKLKLTKKLSVMAGEKVNLEPEFTPVNATNQKLDYTSSDPDIATVSSKGVVTTKKKGKVTITAKTKDGTNKTAKCKLTVTGPGKAKLQKIDNSKKGTAVLKWKEVKDADGYDIYMSTDNKNYKKIQSVKGGTITTYTKKKLKSRTTYYFKIVSYANVGKGKKAYGDESKAVKVTIK